MNWDDDFFDCMDSSFCGCCCGGIERSMMLSHFCVRVLAPNL